MISINLFCCKEKVFMLISTWRNGKKVNEFYSNLNTEDITDVDYMHAERVCKDFKIQNLGEYHDLYLKVM